MRESQLLSNALQIHLHRERKRSEVAATIQHQGFNKLVAAATIVLIPVRSAGSASG
jgi:hypothetical protein